MHSLAQLFLIWFSEGFHVALFFKACRFPLQMLDPVVYLTHSFYLFISKQTQDQENVDPNYTRDTLPHRFFEASAAVFMVSFLANADLIRK